jgi:hypothetical protein
MVQVDQPYMQMFDTFVQDQGSGIKVSNDRVQLVMKVGQRPKHAPYDLLDLESGENVCLSELKEGWTWVEIRNYVQPVALVLLFYANVRVLEEIWFSCIMITIMCNSRMNSLL